MVGTTSVLLVGCQMEEMTKETRGKRKEEALETGRWGRKEKRKKVHFSVELNFICSTYLGFHL